MGKGRFAPKVAAFHSESKTSPSATNHHCKLLAYSAFLPQMRISQEYPVGNSPNLLAFPTPVPFPG
jgi:hypothetical protein